jgi:hypothetical protein
MRSATAWAAGAWLPGSSAKTIRSAGLTRGPLSG